MITPALELGCTSCGNPYTMRRWKIGHGDQAIYKTIKHMQGLAFGPEGVGHPQIRIAAIEAVRGAIKNVDEIDHVLTWVKRNIEFRGEHAETLQSPLVTLQLAAGDCDDHSALVAAMLSSLGYRTQFKTIATNPNDPQFSHVYVIVKDKRNPGRWIGIDTTVGQSFAGWEPPMIFRQRTYPNPHRRTLGQPPPFVPLPAAAPAGLSPTQQMLYDIAAPFAQAGALQLAYGGNPPAQPYYGQPYSPGGPTVTASAFGVPNWFWLVALGAVAWIWARR
jgi:transglutaminase superfamily protein